MQYSAAPCAFEAAQCGIVRTACSCPRTHVVGLHIDRTWSMLECIISKVGQFDAVESDK